MYTKTNVNRIPLRCITLHYITLHYIALHYIALHCIAWHYITLHCAALHYITLPYITLYYLTLPYITYKTKPYLTLPYHTTQNHKIPTMQYPSITSHYITWQATTAAQNTLQYMCMLIQLRPTHTHACTNSHYSFHFFFRLWFFVLILMSFFFPSLLVQWTYLPPPLWQDSPVIAPAWRITLLQTVTSVCTSVASSGVLQWWSSRWANCMWLLNFSRQIGWWNLPPFCCQKLSTPGFSFMCVLAEGFSMPLVVETLSTLAPGEWMSVVTMGLVTTAFCLWAEACALQNVDASVVPWHRKSGPP